jgi:hypothetical protein
MSLGGRSLDKTLRRKLERKVIQAREEATGREKGQIYFLDAPRRRTTEQEERGEVGGATHGAGGSAEVSALRRGTRA